MYPFQQILFPVDYSQRCDAAIPYVSEAVQRFSAALTLVHAYEVNSLNYLPDDVRDREERRLRSFGARMWPGEPLTCIAVPGEATSAIDDVMEQRGTDLVMLPTHGRGGVRSLLLGSVASHVLQNSDAPVWISTIPALADYARRLPYRSILCALDESDEAEGVFRAAVTIAGEYGANLSLVHVVETPATPLELDYDPLKAEVMYAAECKLREWTAQQKVTAAQAVLEGSIAENVCDEARRRDADLIITGRGRIQGKLGRLWSHLQPIIRESPCPVLSI